MGTAIGLGGIEVIALVLEHGGFAEDGKAMGEASWYEELAMVIFGQFYSNVLAIGGRTLADIDGYIEHGSFDATNQFALGKGWGLEVQAAHDAIAGHGFVVLYKVDFSHFFFEFPLGETFEEVASGVFEHFGFDDNEARYFGLNDVHK